MVLAVFVNRAAEGIGDEGLVFAAGDLDVGVAGDGGQLDGAFLRVDGQDHQHVGPLGDGVVRRGVLFPAHLLAELLDLLGAADVHTDQQDVDDVVRQVRVDAQVGRIDGFVDLQLGGQVHQFGHLLGGEVVFPEDDVAVFIDLVFIFGDFDNFEFLVFTLRFAFGKSQHGQQQGQDQENGKQTFHSVILQKQQSSGAGKVRADGSAHQASSQRPAGNPAGSPAPREGRSRRWRLLRSPRRNRTPGCRPVSPPGT